MTNLGILRHEEGVRLRPEPLIALYAELGDLGADRAVCRAIGDISVQLADMQRYAERGDGAADRAALIRAGSALARIAAGIGMVTLARVAQDVIVATQSGDAAAQAATLARLVRIGDRSLHAIWELQDATCAPS